VDLAVRVDHRRPALGDAGADRRLPQRLVAERVGGDQPSPAGGEGGGDPALAAADAADQADDRLSVHATATSATSSQFGPAATSTAKCTARVIAPTISARANSASGRTSPGGASNTSSSCTVKSIRAL